MKIKSLGFSTIQINGAKVSLVTEPNVSMNNGVKLGNIETDMVLNFDDNLPIEGIKPMSKENVMYISNPGEYEMSEVMIQRPMGARLYVIDESSVRVVYIGSGSKKIDKKIIDDLGDVDVLVLPVGVGELFLDYNELETLISKIEPAILVPIAYSDGKIGEGYKSLEEFMKHFGYANTREEVTLKVDARSEEEEKPMEVVILKKS